MTPVATGLDETAVQVGGFPFGTLPFGTLLPGGVPSGGLPRLNICSYMCQPQCGEFQLVIVNYMGTLDYKVRKCRGPQDEVEEIVFLSVFFIFLLFYASVC